MIVVVFHVAAAYALVNGLARKIIEVVRPPLQTKVLEEVKPPPPPDKAPPPPPPPRLAAPPPPFIPPPEVQVQPPPQVQPPTITAVSTVKPVVPPPPIGVPKQPVRRPAVVDAQGCEKPAYPPASQRAHETGTVRLSFLIETNGKVVQSRVDRSSGSRRLDEAARSALGLCNFKPATVDGVPQRAWARIEYVWRLDE